MNRQTVIGCLSAAACAAVITAVSAWAFLIGTASMERDPFHFASIMAENAKARAAQTVTVVGNLAPEEAPDRGLPDLLAPPPPCSGACS